MKSYKETPLEKALGDYLWSLQDQIDSLMEYTDLLGNHCQLTDEQLQEMLNILKGAEEGNYIALRSAIEKARKKLKASE